MRIALRTSGGRGEYEIAGVHGDVSVADLIDHELWLELFPGSSVPTGNVIRRINGKTRIRLRDSNAGDRHSYLLLADILLLPKPKRELGNTPAGKLQLVDNNYSVTSIQFDVVKISEGIALIRPTSMLLENGGRAAARLDILERLKILLEVWGLVRNTNGEVADGLTDLRDAVLTGSRMNIASSARYLRERFGGEGDPLRELTRVLGLQSELSYWMAVHEDDVESALVDDDLESVMEAARLRLRIWRQQALRGAAGALFARRVKAAYGNTCLFSGAMLPKTHLLGNGGVDAAHILPWAHYELNEVSNGLCLNKLCHWAFDAGVLVLEFSASVERYSLSISPRARLAESQGKIDLSIFNNIEGWIPGERLPRREVDWPSPKFLLRYNTSFPSE